MWYIDPYVHLVDFLGGHVGKYTSPMDPRILGLFLPGLSCCFAVKKKLQTYRPGNSIRDRFYPLVGGHENTFDFGSLKT